jgi:hypothetical protein
MMLEVEAITYNMLNAAEIAKDPPGIGSAMNGYWDPKRLAKLLLLLCTDPSPRYMKRPIGGLIRMNGSNGNLVGWEKLIRTFGVWRAGVSVLVRPSAIRSSRRKEKASKTENLLWLVVLPSTLPSPSNTNKT